MSKFTKIPTNTFKEIGINAGVMLKDFTPSSPALDDEDILGATSGGINITAVPSFTDYGEDIDNCPKNTKELKKTDSWEVKASGTFVTMNTALGKRLLAMADVGTTDTTKVTPRVDLAEADFSDLWFVGDYSDKTGATNGGFIAVRLINALSTGGFALQSSDKGKMKFAFEFTGHFSIDAQDTVPIEMYIKGGTDEAAAGGG